MKNHHANQYRADIDGLRALAILSVVGYHAFPDYIKGGFIGVDVFFVLSGYLITGILLRNMSENGHAYSFLDFYIRRIRRIFPALITVLAACFVSGWFFLVPEDFGKLGEHIAGGAGFLSNVLLFRESGYFDITSERKPLLHLWSLGVEEQFYIFWPILLYLFLRLRFKLLSLTIFTLVLSFLLNITKAETHPISTFYLPFTRYWELSIGSVLLIGQLRLSSWRYGEAFMPSLVIKLGTSIVTKNVLSIVGLCFILISTFGLTKNVVYPGWWALLPTTGALMIIAAGEESFINKYILSNKLMVWLGLISFPLYLWHWPLLSFEHIINNSLTASISTTIILLAVSVLFAWLTYKLIEIPVRLNKSIMRTALVLLGLMAIVFSIGLLTFKNNGFPSRMPEDVRGYASIKAEDFHWDEKVRTGICNNQDPLVTEHHDNCIDTKRPLVMLWGDSYAASLYPGLKALQEQYNFGIAQLTSSACPPIIDINVSSIYRKNCEEINRNILNRLKFISPKIIMLQTTWRSEDYQLKQNQLLDKLYSTIDAIKSHSPTSRILIIGPVPRWNYSAAQCITRYYMKYHQKPQERMFYCLMEGTPLLDLKLKSIATQMNIEYISAWNAMCNNKGCLTAVDGKITQLTTIDGGHLSSYGSEYLLQHIATEIFRDAL